MVERRQVAQAGCGNANVGGAIAGALIDGILGHQVVGGHGEDLAANWWRSCSRPAARVAG
jgi:uncharacterized protein YcfJ